jgi:hypothetical protein
MHHSTGIYLFLGFDGTRKEKGQTWHPWVDRPAVVDRCAYVARAVEHWLDLNPPEEYPHNFERDVLEHLGTWLYSHYNATTVEVEAELVNRMALCMPEVVPHTPYPAAQDNRAVRGLTSSP